MLLAALGFLGVLDRIGSHVAQIDQPLALDDIEPLAIRPGGDGTLAIGRHVLDEPRFIATRNRGEGIRGKRGPDRVQPLEQISRPVNDHGGAAIGRAAAEVEPAQHVVGVLEEIAVDVDGPGRRGIIRRPDPCLVGRVGIWLGALFQDDDVGHDRRAGIALERPGGQAIGGNQIGLLCQLDPRGAALLVHRAGARDADDKPARPGLVQRLEEKVIVQRRPQPVIAPICGALRCERPVPDHQVIEVIGGGAVLVALDADVGVREQPLSHRAGLLVEFDASPVGAGGEVGRHHREEVANAHRRLKDTAAIEAHCAHHVPHRHDGGRVGIVGVDDGALGRFPFGLAQLLAQPVVLGLPAVPIDRPLPRALEQFLPERAPADIAGDGIEFFRGGVAPFALDALHRFQGGAVAGETGLGAAADNPLGVGQDVIGASFRRNGLVSPRSSQSRAACSCASAGLIPAFRPSVIARYHRSHRTSAACVSRFDASSRLTASGDSRRQRAIRSLWTGARNRRPPVSASATFCASASSQRRVFGSTSFCIYAPFVSAASALSAKSILDIIRKRFGSSSA